MTSCCVPYCKVNQRTSTGFSFHEFPSNPDLRVEWIRAISRIDPKTNEYWVPNQRSLVCSRHFTPDQYCKTYYSKKRLLPKSVPCVFPGYPDYLLKNSAFCKRFSSPPSKEDCTTHIVRIPASTNIVKVTSVENSDININKKHNELEQTSSNKSAEKDPSVVESGEDNDVNDEDNDVNGEDNDLNSAEVEMDCDEIRPIQISRELNYNVNSSGVSNLENIHEIRNVITESFGGSLQEESENVINDYLSTEEFPHSLQNVSPSPEKSISFSCNCVYSNVVKRCILLKQKNKSVCKTDQSKWTLDKTYKRLRHEINSAKGQIRRQRERILKLVEVNKAMTEKFKNYNIDTLEQKTASNDPKALFITDQLRSLKKKNILWSESTMEFSKCLEKKFPAAYSFLSQTDIVSLPSLKTLRFFPTEVDDDDSDSAST